MLRRIELILEPLPVELAMRVAEHGIYVTRNRPENQPHVQPPLKPNREVGVSGEPA